MKIAVDFDGTCVEYDYPFIGSDIGSVPVLRELIEKGHQLILYTMRTGRELEMAKDWFKHHGLELFGVQFDPEQSKWTNSNKCYAHLYIDDAALGIPLIDDSVEKKPYVDWIKARDLLVEKGYL